MPWRGAAVLLRDAILAAVTTPAATLPHPGHTGSTLTLAWGSQADVRPVRRGIDGELDDHKVAAYIAKYASKATKHAGGIPVRIRSAAGLDDWNVTGHARRLIATCWPLGHREEYAHLRLARWAHQLGYGGHFSTRSRRYSVTLGSRQQRQAWRNSQDDTGNGRSRSCPNGTTRAPASPRTHPVHDRRLNFPLHLSRARCACRALVPSPPYRVCDLIDHSQHLPLADNPSRVPQPSSALPAAQ